MSKAKKLYILLGILAAFSTLTFIISRLEVQKEQIKMRTAYRITGYSMRK